MPKAILTVRTSAASRAAEAAYNSWYEKVHIPEVCNVPGFVSASRYKLHAQVETDLPTYLAIYELDADDPAESVAEMRRRVAAGDIQTTDTVAADPKPESALYLAV